MYKNCNTNTSKLFINQPLLPPTVICAHERPEESLSMGKPIAAYSVLQMYYPTIIWMKRTLIITRDIGRHVYHCVSGATITSTRVHWCRLHQTISSPYLLSEETSCLVFYQIKMNIWCENGLTSDFDIHFVTFYG